MRSKFSGWSLTRWRPFFFFISSPFCTLRLSRTLICMSTYQKKVDKVTLFFLLLSHLFLQRGKTRHRWRGCLWWRGCFSWRGWRGWRGCLWWRGLWWRGCLCWRGWRGCLWWRGLWWRGCLWRRGWLWIDVSSLSNRTIWDRPKILKHRHRLNINKISLHSLF